MNRGANKMSNRNATVCSESIRHELRSLEEQLADAWWHEKPLECIEELEQQIEARSAILSKASPHRKR